MPMARPAQDVTPAELAVLQVLWDQPGCTIREIAARLYPDGGTSEYATVQKRLDRLEGKDFAARDASAVPHRFRAAIDRDDLVGQRLRQLADSLCGGSLAPILSNLVGTQPLKDEEVDELRALVERLDAARKVTK
jgi:predicted transcriptional regulator